MAAPTSARSPHPRRLAAAALAGGLALAAGALAWPWLRAGLLEPLALLAWLLLRVFVLSVDQRVWWLFLVAAAPVLLALALRPRPGVAGRPWVAGPAPRVHPVAGWREQIDQAARGLREQRAFGWDGFVQLTLSLTSLQRRQPPDYLLHEELRSGQLPLPPRVRAFLFPPAPAPASRWARLGLRLRSGPRRALRLTGRERRAHLRSISQLLTYLEDALEPTSHDDEHDRADL
jgi:hypothetical protein